jgi:PST family polysaccharide transporter/lipopolysaccharide exporter
VGDKWLPSIPALEVLCIFGVFEILIMISAQILLAVGKPSVTFYTSIVRLIIILIFIYPIIIWQGILGVAILVTISTLIQAILMNNEVCNITQTSWLNLIQKIAPALISSLIMFLAIFLIKIVLPSTFFTLIILIGLGILIYVISLYIISKGKIIENIKEITSAFKTR